MRKYWALIRDLVRDWWWMFFPPRPARSDWPPLARDMRTETEREADRNAARARQQLGRHRAGDE